MTPFAGVWVVAGARPQFVKAAALLPAMPGAKLVHTGQHADHAMVEAHFAGLGMRAPDAVLGRAWPRERGARLEAMTTALADLYRRAGARRAVVVGDTDSTLAGALAAVQAGIPCAHVEAGARSQEPDLPEEKIRIQVDAKSDLLFCSVFDHADNLRDRTGVHLCGDVMADVLLAREIRIRARTPDRAPYAVMTIHRAATADDPAVVAGILQAVAATDIEVLFPRHPRTRAEQIPAGITLLAPLPYVEFLGYVAGAEFVLTDSGGLQKEAYLLGVPCITLRPRSEWMGTVRAGWNTLVGTDPARIIAACAAPPRGQTRPPLFGDGRAAQAIAELIRPSLR